MARRRGCAVAVLSLLRGPLLNYDLTPALRAPSASDERSAGGVAHQQRARQALNWIISRPSDPTQTPHPISAAPFPPRHKTIDRLDDGSTPGAERDRFAPARRRIGALARIRPAAKQVECGRSGRRHRRGSPSGLPATSQRATSSRPQHIPLAQPTRDHHCGPARPARRILYERFREQLLSGPLESQRLLIPRDIEV